MNFQKRRNYFVEKQFQTKYILLTVLLLLTYTFILVVVLFAPYMLTLYLDYPLVERADASKVIIILHQNVWLWLGGVILFFGAVSIFFSHKIAGPLFRIKKLLDTVAHGDLGVFVKLRKSDDLKDLAEHINQVISELKTFLTTLKHDDALLSRYIVDLEREIQAKIITEESGKETVRKVQECRKNIETALQKFNLPQ